MYPREFTILLGILQNQTIFRAELLKFISAGARVLWTALTVTPCLPGENVYVHNTCTFAPPKETSGAYPFCIPYVAVKRTKHTTFSTPPGATRDVQGVLTLSTYGLHRPRCRSLKTRAYVRSVCYRSKVGPARNTNGEVNHTPVIH